MWRPEPCVPVAIAPATVNCGHEGNEHSRLAVASRGEPAPRLPSGADRLTCTSKHKPSVYVTPPSIVIEPRRDARRRRLEVKHAVEARQRQQRAALASNRQRATGVKLWPRPTTRTGARAPRTADRSSSRDAGTHRARGAIKLHVAYPGFFSSNCLVARCASLDRCCI